MAATQTAIPAAELAARAADFPAVVGKNALQIAYRLAAANLVTNTAGDLGTGDQSASGFDRRALQDRFRHTLWKQTAASTALYIVVDTGVADGSGQVDTLVVENHNWSGQAVEVKANDTAPPVGDSWTGADTVFSFTQSAGNVLVVRLHATTAYSARYWRIKVSGSSLQRQAGQVWLGKAVQFPKGVLLGGDPEYAASGRVIEAVTETGIRTGFRVGPSLIERSVACRFQEGRNGTFLTKLRDWFESTQALDGGIRAFWWIDQPGTNRATDRTRFVYLTDPVFKPRALAGSASEIKLEFQEQGGLVGAYEPVV